MISYIFRNKYKNVFVAVAAVVFLMTHAGKIYSTAIMPSFGTVVPLFTTFLYPLAVLFYMLTLKREYGLKRWLFPAAFALRAAGEAFTFLSLFDLAYDFSDTSALITFVCALAVDLILLVAYILSIIGSLSDFKRVRLLRVGTLICGIYALICFAVFCYEAVFFFQRFNESVEHWYVDLLILSGSRYRREAIEQLTVALLCFSILLLTFGKKGENIDITPFVEARKAKKEAKRADKLQRETEIKAITQKTSEGYWCCMGCGKILPDSESKCECGYKKRS